MTPGGRLEPGEREEDAAVRELDEETGIAIDASSLVGPLHRATLGGRDMVFFAADVGAAEVSFDGHQPDEREYVVGYEWLDPQSLAGDPRLTYDALPDVAARAVAAVRGSAVRRRTARVVPVNEDGAALLLLDQDPARPGELRWGTIGGAVDPGESLLEAAVRELYEETGIVAPIGDLTTSFHQDELAFSHAGVAYIGDSTFFAMSLPRDVEITFDHLEPAEIGNVLEARWLTPDELVRDGRLVAPSLPDIITSAIRAVEGTR